jgi:hypothetical protein
MDDAQILAWHALVHVSRKWRSVVFGSPRRLNLRLYCRPRTPAREMLDVWPPLPIIIRAYSRGLWGADNLIVALEHNDRVSEINLWSVQSLPLKKVLAAMQKPFPELTYLQLRHRDETAPVVPATFLGQSAPRLQRLNLDGIPFPGVPKLLSSATHLVDLFLRRIPHSGYISPEAMVTGLSTLTRLESLEIGFDSPRSRPDQKSQRPPTRTALPSPFSPSCDSKGSANIWRTSWPGSVPLY